MMTEAVENWARIPGYEDYEVSSIGRVRKGALVMKIQKNRQGYDRIGLRSQGRTKHFAVHRLMLLAFVGEAPSGYQGAHLDVR